MCIEIVGIGEGVFMLVSFFDLSSVEYEIGSHWKDTGFVT